MLPGTHDIEHEEIVIDSLTAFEAACGRLRRRFPTIARKKLFRDHDRNTWTFPAIYELVFRGQTKDYPSSTSTKPSLLPSALRPGVIHPPHDRRQAIAYFDAMITYCVNQLDIPDMNVDKIKGNPANVVRILMSGPNVEQTLNWIALYSKVTAPHECVLLNWPTAVPPLSLVLDDWERFHEPGSIAVVWELAPLHPARSGPPQRLQWLVNGYINYVLGRNLDSPLVKSAVLQHYGFPTKCLDVTFDPLVALWFALNQREARGDDFVYTRHHDLGYVYVLWVPAWLDWPSSGLDWYRWARRRGYSVDWFGSYGAPGLLVDLSSFGMTILLPDERTRGPKQKAALLTGMLSYPDWPPNAYAEYLVAKMIIAPNVWEELREHERGPTLTADYLFPTSEVDLLLSAFLDAGFRGIDKYATVGE